MFSVFRKNMLLPIKNNSTPSEISDWKKSEQVTECYENLFKLTSESSNQSVLSRIVEKVFLGEGSPSNIQVAYVIAVCITMLSPQYEKIMIDKKAIKSKMSHFLVGLLKIFSSIFYTSQVFNYLLIFYFKKKLNDDKGIEVEDCKNDTDFSDDSSENDSSKDNGSEDNGSKDDSSEDE
jgi:hypothetical protein